MLFLMPIHSTSSINNVFAFTSISSSSVSWLRIRPLSESSACCNLSCSLITDSSISPTSVMRRYWTGSRQSSTFGREVRVSSHACASFNGCSLSEMDVCRRVIFSSISFIWAIICKTVKSYIYRLRRIYTYLCVYREAIQSYANSNTLSPYLTKITNIKFIGEMFFHHFILLTYLVRSVHLQEGNSR